MAFGVSGPPKLKATTANLSEELVRGVDAELIRFLFDCSMFLQIALKISFLAEASMQKRGSLFF